VESNQNSATVVNIAGLSKLYGQTQALDNVSLTIPAGTVFALLGENGAGKSTCLKTLLGLEKPDSGSAHVLGMNCQTDGIKIRSTVGYVPESPALYDWMTVEETGWFAAGFYGGDFITEFKRLAAEFDLPINQKIKKLSKGGRAKVSLALATAHRPPLLIMDEPTSGLDTLVRRKFLESMIEVTGSGRTVLLSSHQIPDVERVADIVAIVNQGKVLICEPLEELKQMMEQWVVTLDSDGLKLPTVKAEILLYEGRDSRRRRLLVRNPSPECLWTLRDHPGVTEVAVHTPSLEEIFVAVIRSRSPDAIESNRTDTAQSSDPSSEVKQ
jgi:ABC-2 type transport system ATP-binding protein